MSRWLIYGANGFSGTLIAEEAKRRGLSPILAGRNAAACMALAQRLGLESRAFSCDLPESILPHLSGVDLVLHCAGPFSKTSAPMLEACLQTQAHYLDITGEISVFESIHSQSDRVRVAGVVAIPGVGFDVVPSDCLAAMLKEKLPDATRLSLAFKSSGTLTPGTAKTLIEALGQPGAVRENGKIQPVPSAYATRNIKFTQKAQLSVTIPWGDVSTAFYSTGIPNIRVYLGTSVSTVCAMRVARIFRKPLSSSWVQSSLKRIAERWIQGPSPLEMKNGRSILWGEVSNSRGKVVSQRLKVPEPYSLTAITAVTVAQKVLEGGIPSGTHTPSQAFGSRFILDFPGVELDA